MKNIFKNLEKYTLCIAKNILQIKKSQLDAKLDKDLQNATKNYVIETKIFNGDDTNFDYREIERY